ncbi:hypothetical protein DFS33DRAFT_1274321 [Desarmillaria ectypa]|nr:hypothetical protein DFS33DRAFT_1274321 [Desarmillaria ectypa]
MRIVAAHWRLLSGGGTKYSGCSITKMPIFPYESSAVGPWLWYLLQAYTKDGHYFQEIYSSAISGILKLPMALLQLVISDLMITRICCGVPQLQFCYPFLIIGASLSLRFRPVTDKCIRAIYVWLAYQFSGSIMLWFMISTLSGASKKGRAVVAGAGEVPALLAEPLGLTRPYTPPIHIQSAATLRMVLRKGGLLEFEWFPCQRLSSSGISAVDDDITDVMLGQVRPAVMKGMNE